jgi:phytanoyl-CoA hydroxylase
MTALSGTRDSGDSDSGTRRLEASRQSGEPLSREQVRFFRQTSYLRLVDAFGDRDVEVLTAELVTRFASAIGPVRRNSSGQVVRLSHAFERDPLFREVFTSPVVLAPLRSLLGPNVEFVLNRHNHVTVNDRESKSLRLHRDVLQWSRPIVSVMVYLEATSELNGCTHIIPSSHFLPFVGTPNNGGTWMDEHHVYSDLLGQALPVPMPAGGVLLFDGLAFHSSGFNSSPAPRFAMTGAYHSVDELLRPAPAMSVLVCGERLHRGDS